MEICDTTYSHIANTIEHINHADRQPPSLDHVSTNVGLARLELENLFNQWAGVGLQQFAQSLSLESAKQRLNSPSVSQPKYTQTPGHTNKSNPTTIIKAITAKESNNGGKALSIQYNFAPSPFGKVLIASTTQGVCHIAFVQSEPAAIADLKARHPKAKYHRITQPSLIEHTSGEYGAAQSHPAQNRIQQATLVMQNGTPENKNRQNAPITLHLKATDFQLDVWQALLNIPFGALSSYGEIAQSTNNPKASRAVGTAIGRNPVAYLIPCHRVIQASGQQGGYRWGKTRKSAILGWEAAKMVNLK